ncbi:MAG: hypothetical protein RLY15_116 [Bacteroidota bacterium]
MMNIKKYWKKRGFLISLPISIYFNFYYLPFKQAIRLPILLFKPKLLKLKGKIILNTSNIYPGMIRLGYPLVSIYPNNGISIENKGGTIIFKGKCNIGNNSFLSIGDESRVVFGDDFLASSTFRLVVTTEVIFGMKVRLGWGAIVIDTNFHQIRDLTNNDLKDFCGPIKIGDYNWFGLECTIMHSVETPERCIFGLKSIITRGAEFKSYCIHAGEPLRIIKSNVIRDY